MEKEDIDKLPEAVRTYLRGIKNPVTRTREAERLAGVIEGERTRLRVVHPAATDDEIEQFVQKSVLRAPKPLPTPPQPARFVPANIRNRDKSAHRQRLRATRELRRS